MIDNPVWGCIIQMLEVLGANLIASDREFNIVPTTDSQIKFWAGVASRVLSKKTGIKRLKFTGEKNPFKRGKSCVDAEVLSHSQNVVGENIFKYLPKTVATDGGKKYINREISLLGGAQGLKALEGLPTTLTEIFKSKHVTSKYTSGALDDYRISYGQAVAGLQRTKTIKSKKKGIPDKVVSISLVRPSEKMEVLTQTEVHLLQKLEEPWNKLAALSDEWEKGVKICNIKVVREAYSRYYADCFNANARINSWCAKRRRILSECAQFLTGKKDTTVTKSLKEQIMNELPSQIKHPRIKREENPFISLFNSLNPAELQLLFGKSEKWTNYAKSKYLFENIPNQIWRSLSTEDYNALIEHYVNLGLPEPKGTNEDTNVSEWAENGPDDDIDLESIIPPKGRGAKW